MMLLHHSMGLLATLCVVFPIPAAEENLSREEIGKRGKAATALVEVKARKSYGSAFCVHPSGLFVTNEHVVREPDASSIQLVLDPGLKTQRVVKVQVVRVDRETDLALLRVEGENHLPTLPLGSTDHLTELTELIACGFPFGTALAPEKDGYPAISINVGSVTSLRSKDGKLHRIQLDAVLNPGNSGGPVLDRKGQVVGVVVAGVLGAGVNFAIPIGQVRGFLSRPDLHFKPPTLTQSTRNKPVQFHARAVALLPDSPPLSLELILQADNAKERKFPMKGKDGLYQVAAVPLPGSTEPGSLMVTIRFPNGAVRGEITDPMIFIDGKPYLLGQLKGLRRDPGLKAILHDGQTLAGKITGLEAIRVQLGGETLTLDLTRAIEVNIVPRAVSPSVTYTLVVRQADMEVGRFNGSLADEDSAARRYNAVPSLAIKAPSLTQEKVVRQLPSTFSEVTVGGGGRFLFFHLPKIRKLAVFDVNEAKIVHYVPLAEDQVKFAAGMDKLIVVFDGSHLIQRWDLKTFDREATAPLPIKRSIKSICMGSASNGPLLVHSSEGVGPLDRAPSNFLDIHTLKMLQFDGFDTQATAAHNMVEIRASADGRVFTSMFMNPGQSGTLILTGNTVKRYYVQNNLGHMVPGPDGKVIFTGIGLFTNECKPISGNQPGSYSFPAVHGQYYMTFQPGAPPGSGKVTVHLTGDHRPLLTLPAVEGVSNPTPFGTSDIARRLYLLPDAKLIISLPQTNDRLILQQFDVEEALTRSGVDYLFVTSRAPLHAKKGELYSYQVVAKTKKGGLRYKLESGPKGMVIANDGRLTWPVPPDFTEVDTTVIVTLRDATGQECFHTFSINLTD
jgi:serine protease Do